MLNVQRLRVLRAVADGGSFSRAAEALSYTQSAVSQAIATLETETGATLIERDRRGVRPTAVGGALVAHADLDPRRASTPPRPTLPAILAGAAAPADGLVPDRGRDADAARDRDASARRTLRWS